MNRYEKPMIIAYHDTAEGVYLASGGAADNSDAANNIKCDSRYMNGNWQAPDYSDWNGGTRGYRQQFGCLGCPANTASACGLKTHYVDSGYAGSYDTDNGNRMPSWERKGYGPDDPVVDWNI